MTENGRMPAPPLMPPSCPPPVDTEGLVATEKTLLDAIAGGTPTGIFILGAPRTGSTLLYQLMADRFELPYIANLTNDRFAATPIVGLAIQKAVPVEIAFESSYGKTAGPFQPSEGSGVMMNWFGGGHPSEIRSTSILEGREAHLRATLAAVDALYGAPLLVKNAWNCFRIRWLAGALPAARFIWIRRDIRAAAISDLEARYRTKGDPGSWNSATPANVDELRKLPPALQVVENQIAFNRAIAGALAAQAPERSLEVWYEDLVREPDAVLARISMLIGRSGRTGPTRPAVSERRPTDRAALAEAVVIADHVATRDDLVGDVHPAAEGSF